MTGEVTPRRQVDGRGQVGCDQEDHRTRTQPGDVVPQIYQQRDTGPVAAVDHDERLLRCAAPVHIHRAAYQATAMAGAGTSAGPSPRSLGHMDAMRS